MAVLYACIRPSCTHGRACGTRGLVSTCLISSCDTRLTCATVPLHPTLSAQKAKAKERKKRQKEEAKMKEMGLEPPPKPVQHVGSRRDPGP